jgi:hypothetical protein
MQENPALISLSDISMEDLGKMDKETQLGLLSNASVSDLSDFSEEKITALKAKLQRMQANNEKEPAWDRSKHWPLLEALQEKSGDSYIPIKDRPRGRL